MSISVKSCERVQVLLALYFFLAGIAVSQRRLLLLTPVCTAICSVVLSAATTLSAWLLPSFRCATVALCARRRVEIKLADHSLLLYSTDVSLKPLMHQGGGPNLMP